MTWVIGPWAGHSAPLPNDWYPNHAKGGKFLTPDGQAAGGNQWQLIFERWGDHRMGDVKRTPRKDTEVFRTGSRS